MKYKQILTSIFLLFYIFIQSQNQSIFQSFTLDDYDSSPSKVNSYGASGCFYSKTMTENKKGKYYYVDNYNDNVLVKFNSKFYEFEVNKYNNKFAERKGFVNASYQSKYKLELVTSPVYEKGKYKYTSANLIITNKESKKTAKISLVGFCGC